MTAETPPLPPALARLVAGLRLSSGFHLAFVSGPRDHRDSVFLRLARELGREFELVRHRLDRDGLHVLEALRGQSDARPRLVFLSGLENMSDDLRQESAARLNLRRDSWGIHPARVVFWLPSWALREFRDLAPDLFDWRSNLTVLYDADLPVRDEPELLVWTCERFRDAAPSLDLPRRFHPLFAPTELRELVSERRSVFTGYEAAERGQLLRRFTLHLATLRLDLLHDHAHPARLDLDVLQLEVPPLEDPSRTVDAPAPVLLRAIDAASMTAIDDPWASAAQVAGVPGGEQAAAVLADVGARGELLVLLDGFDLVPPDSPAQQLIDALAGTSAALASFTSGPPPPPVRAWKGHVRDDRRWSTPRSAELAGLLSRLFAGPDELRRLAAHLFGPDLAHELPTSGATPDVAGRLVDALERRGLADRALFAELRRMRPRDADAIAAAEDSYLHGTGAQDMS